MRLTYTLVEDGGRFVAECVESDAVGEGMSQAEAVDSLRKALEERMFRPDAVAPPSDTARATIDLERIDEIAGRQSADLSGPGDAR